MMFPVSGISIPTVMMEKDKVSTNFPLLDVGVSGYEFNKKESEILFLTIYFNF